MALGVQQIWIVPTVIVTFKLQELRAPGVGAGKAQG